MILKVVNYEQRVNQNDVYEVTDYIDRISNASVSFDEEIGLPTVKCTIDNSAIITISVPNIAYLMNDNGRTIDRITKVDNDSDGVFPELHEAIDEALRKSVE